jgi:hypothetical protein
VLIAADRIKSNVHPTPVGEDAVEHGEQSADDQADLGDTAPPTGPARYDFKPPQVAAAPKIEYRRVRQPAAMTLAEDRQRRRWFLSRRQNWLLAAGVIVVLLAGVGWVGIRGLTAKDHLQNAATLFLKLRQQTADTDLAGAKATLIALQSETAQAKDITDGLDWAIAGRVPFIGDDLTAVRTVSEVLDDLASNGLPALLDVATGFDPSAFVLRNGRMDLAALQSAAPRIATGLAVVQRARENVARIHTAGLAAELTGAVQQLSSGLSGVERLIKVADRTARLLPTMLGAKGPRHYLLLFQNNAESRATGGMPGAYIVVKADKGAIKIEDQGSTAGDLDAFETPVQKLSADMESLYTDRLAVFPADVNLTPDFPTAAQLAQIMYQKRKGLKVNGVLATDPIALSYLLHATGAVKVPRGEPLTADNAVRTLLSEVYSKYEDPSDQDAYFADTARATFETLLNGQGDPRGLVAELAKAAGERRLLVWSADREEEALIGDTVLAGRLPADDGMSPTVGVFLNDGSGSKLSYYLAPSATLTAGACETDGTRELHLKLTVGSTAPKSGLPAYVTGLALSGDEYTSRTNVMVFSPTGGGIVSVTESGKEIHFGTGLERDRGVGVITMDLPPGKTRTFNVAVQTGVLPEPRGAVRPQLWTTPGVRSWKSSVTRGSRCT